MPDLTRREFAELISATGVAATTGAATLASPALAQGRAQVVIVGGGAGGATVARRLKNAAPDVNVSLVEMAQAYSSSFLSEHFIGGFRSLNSLTHRYDGLAAAGVTVINGRATGINAGKRELSLLDGTTLPYDRLVISPGIDLKYEKIEGYSRDAAIRMPHAWKYGAQNLRLRNQLLDMNDGGVVVMSVPLGPVRGGSAPYTRASMVAHYLKFHKPRSKLILLDANRDFDQRAVFEAAWQENYAGLLEHHLSTAPNEFGVARVDPNTLEVETWNSHRFKGDVVSIVPEHRAGLLAQNAGCVDGDWCPVDPATFASKRVDHIHVLGDAADLGRMPKTAFVANSAGAVLANHLAAELAGKKRFPVRYRNTQWSLIATNNAIKAGASYVVGKGEVVEATAFASDASEPAAVRARNFEESLHWYDAMVEDMFGSV